MKKFIVILLLITLFACLVSCDTDTNIPNQGGNIELPEGNGNNGDTDGNGGSDNDNDGNTDNPAGDSLSWDDIYDQVYILTQTGAANLRTQPSFKETAKGISLKNNSLLTRTGCNKDWSKVEYEGKTYYIANKVIIEKSVLDGFSDTSAQIKITTNLLNVRCAPARTTDDPVCQLKKDQIAEVVAFNKDIGSAGWYKIKLEGENLPEYGYISAHSDYSEVISKAPDTSDTLDTLGGKTPEQLYSSALSSLSGISNYTFATMQYMTMTVEGETQEITQLVFTQRDGRDEYVVIQSQADPSLDTVAWYIDEVFYAITPSQQFKAGISYEDYVEKYMPEGSTSDSALMNIPKDWFVDTKFSYDTEEQLYYIEFIVSGEEYLQYMSSSSLAGSVDGIDDIVYRAYFDEDGVLCDVTTEFTMTVEGIDVQVFSVSEVYDVGTTVIIPPEDTENWTDLTGQI